MTVVIIGLGLIGGSLAGASRKKFPKARIIGITRNRSALATAKRKGWIHEGYRDLRCIAGDPPPIVILCTPVDTLKDFLLRLDRAAPPGTIVTDTGSVKGFLVSWAARRKWKRIHFVGAHPMAGSHERGIRNAAPDLFEGSTTFVTPSMAVSGRQYRHPESLTLTYVSVKGEGSLDRDSSPATKRGGLRMTVGHLSREEAFPADTVINFWKRISSRVVVLSAEEHDRITAEISHLPHLLASVLVTSVSEKATPFASTGFLDTTRVAQGAGDLWAPILLENQREIRRALAGFETRLAEFKKILARKAGRRLLQLLNRAGVRRKRIKLISRGLLL